MGEEGGSRIGLTAPPASSLTVARVLGRPSSALADDTISFTMYGKANVWNVAPEIAAAQTTQSSRRGRQGQGQKNERVRQEVCAGFLGRTFVGVILVDGLEHRPVPLLHKLLSHHQAASVPIEFHATSQGQNAGSEGSSSC